MQFLAGGWRLLSPLSAAGGIRSASLRQLLEQLHVLLGACSPAPGNMQPLTPTANDTFLAQPSSILPDLDNSGGKTSLLPPSRTRYLLLNLPHVCRSHLLSILLPIAVSRTQLICFSSALLTSFSGSPWFSPGIGRVWGLCPLQTWEHFAWSSASAVLAVKASWSAGEEVQVGS